MPKVYNKHHKDAPPDAVYVGRGSPWGNPFVMLNADQRDAVCDKFELEILPKLDLAPLRGKDLVCFCAPRRCHADSLVKAANK